MKFTSQYSSSFSKEINSKPVSGKSVRVSGLPFTLAGKPLPTAVRWQWVSWLALRISTLWVFVFWLLFVNNQMKFLTGLHFSAIGVGTDSGSSSQSLGGSCKKYQELVHQSAQNQGDLSHLEPVQFGCDSKVLDCWMLGACSWHGGNPTCFTTRNCKFSLL